MIDVDFKNKLMNHLFCDLLKFWDRKEALGTPIGNFPTYRNNDGSAFNYRNPSNEYMQCVEELYKPHRDYVRMKARQCFAYGLTYQLTKKMKYFDYMKKGLNYLKNNARDNNGIFYSYYSTESNEWEPEQLQRTSQDIAYALCGYALYYSITGDKKALDIIMRHIHFIEENYYDKHLGILRWVAKKSVDGDSPNALKLVSVLDQIYAYLLCLAKCSENPYADKVHYLLEEFSNIMKEKFFWPERNMFYGEYDEKKGGIDGEHTDFGHSIKAFWMLYEVGQILRDTVLIDFSKANISKLLPKAFDKKSGSWGCKLNKDGSLNTNKEWWSICILNQVAAIFSKYYPNYMEYLNSSLDFWFKYMVDHEHGGIWHLVNGLTNKPNPYYPKQHIWKNAFHEFEHISIIINSYG